MIAKKIRNIYTKGFTLIELLVVIAIIGVLSSIVLSQLNSARGKSIDAQKKSTFKNMNNAGIIYFEANNTYNAVCSDTTTRFGDMVSASGGACSSWAASPSGYRVRTQLRSEDKIAPLGTADWICTDQFGNIKIYGADPGAANAPCP